MTRKPRARLTAREREIVELLAEGNAPKEIAGRLGISHWTVRNHIASARRRTDSATTVQLVARLRDRKRPINRSNVRIAI